VNREFRLISSSLLLWGIGEGLFAFFQPLYLQQLGASPVQIGGILGLASLGLTVSHIPAGALADKIGRRTLMRASSVLGVVATWIMFLAPGLPLFIVGLVLYYFTAFVMSPMSSYATAARGGWTVERALTTIFAFFSIGAILGPIIGGQLSERIGLRSIYGISSVLCVGSTIVMFLLPPQPTESDSLRSSYKRLLSNRSFGGLLALFLITCLALCLAWPLTPNFLQNERGVSLAAIGIFGSVYSLGSVVLNLVLGRMRSTFAFLLSQLLIGASAAILWLGTGTPWFALGYFLYGGYRTARAMMTSLTETQVERSQMGLAFGLVETVGGLALLVAAPIAGLLYRAAPHLPYPISMGLIALSLIISGLYLPRLRSSTEPLTNRRE
jgi:MFS family permease